MNFNLLNKRVSCAIGEAAKISRNKALTIAGYAQLYSAHAGFKPTAKGQK